MDGAAVPSASSRSGGESFSGPWGPGAQHTGWDGAVLELHGDGRFVLELWRFWEQWGYLPEDAGEASVHGPSGRTGNATPEEAQKAATRAAIEKGLSNGQNGLRVREVEEVRATFAGRAGGGLQRREAPAVRLHGFARSELNQAYMEDSDRQVGGQPTWWSGDGRYFLYFVQENQHWKVNSVRLAGGDGMKNVQPGKRKDGHGFAHSGPVGDGEDASAALRSASGWFECMEHEWEPVEVKPLILPAWEITFRADNVVIEERHARGDDSHTEKHVAPEVSFRGWRDTPGGEMRLVLPPIPDRHIEGEVNMQPVSAELVPVPVEGAKNFLGDPDMLILRPAARM